MPIQGSQPSKIDMEAALWLDGITRITRGKVIEDRSRGNIIQPHRIEAYKYTPLHILPPSTHTIGSYFNLMMYRIVF